MSTCSRRFGAFSAGNHTWPNAALGAEAASGVDAPKPDSRSNDGALRSRGKPAALATPLRSQTAFVIRVRFRV